jgi:hypothetical protein
VVTRLCIASLAGTVLTGLGLFAGVEAAAHGTRATGAVPVAASSPAGCLGRWAVSTRGRPRAPGAGYRLWRDPQGWHLRATPGAHAVRFVSRIDTARRLHSMRAVGLERVDAVTRGHRRIALRLRVAGKDVDGIDFRVRCGRVAFALGAQATAWPPRRIYIGAAGRAPGRSFVATDPASTGIQGRVWSGPNCPVEGVPECAGGGRRPVHAIVDVKKAAGRFEKPIQVRTVETDDEGRLRVELPPGDYLLEPRSSDPSLEPTPASARVERGLITRVDLMLGSGIY